MIDGVRVIKKLNEKAVMFSYRGCTFGWPIDRLNSSTKQDLDNAAEESKRNSRRLKKTIKQYKKEYESMTPEQKEVRDGFFERWNEFDDD